MTRIGNLLERDDDDDDEYWAWFNNVMEPTMYGTGFPSFIVFLDVLF